MPAAPSGTRDSFERLRRLHAYGVLSYDNFTVVTDFSWVVLEQALRERFIAFYDGMIPLVGANGARTHLPAPDFETLNTAFRQRRSHHRQGWQLQLHRQGSIPMRLPLTLRPLLLWAREERLLHGQRNRRVEEDLYTQIRNRFAHGNSFHIDMPIHSARSIHNLAEIINRLWGEATPGGRLYPAPLQRDVMAIGWSTGEQGLELELMEARQFAGQASLGDWMYMFVLGYRRDERLLEFDAGCEVTVYPTDLLWGPGRREDAITWLEETAPAGDEVTYLDWVFALRRHNRRITWPCRPEVLLGLPNEHQAGTWHLIRADFPDDCIAHIRHIEAGKPNCPAGQISTRCAVEEITTGAWAEVTAHVMTLFPGMQPETYRDIRAPRRWAFSS